MRLGYFFGSFFIALVQLYLQMNNTSRMIGLMIGLWLAGYGLTPAAVQNWDLSTTTGYQHGDGTWSTDAADTNWTAAGTAPRLAWSQTNEATFSSLLAGSSQVTLSGALTATYVLVSGNFYTLGMNPAELEVGASGIALSGKTNNFTIRNGSRVTLLASVSPALKVRGSYNSLLIDNSTVSNVNDAVILIGFTGGTRGNSLIVTNNGRLYGVAQIGVFVNDSNETAVVVGGAGVTSYWDMASVLYNFNLGNGNNDGNNTLRIDGAGFPGSAIVTNINKAFYVGGNPRGRGDQLIVTNGGLLYSSVTLSFVNNGTTAGSTDNGFVVTGTGSLWEAGAAAVSAGGAGTTNNVIQVRNGGVATNLGAITIDGVSNGLVVANGGKLFSKATTLGNAAGATLIYASVSGGNSLWNLGGQNLTVGALGRTNNSLLIDQAGTVDNVATLTVNTNIRWC